MDFLAQGMNEREARRQVSELLGYTRIDMSHKYVSKGFTLSEDDHP